MNNIELKINDLKNYALNINALSDVSFLINKFNDLNNEKLEYEQKVSLSELLMFMIEQITARENDENDLKIEIIKDIIKNYIFNNLEMSFYYYYLTIREASFYGRNDFPSILSEMLSDDISFLNEFQKISFTNFLKLLREKLEDKELIDSVIEKVKKVEIYKDNYPEFAPSKIKTLEEQNKSLQEELANVNYTLMMGGLL